MTVEQLIKKLSQLQPHYDVVFVPDETYQFEEGSIERVETNHASSLVILSDK